MPSLQPRRLAPELQMLRLWASSGTSANTIAAERRRKLELAKRFTPELPVDRKLPHSLIEKLAAAQRNRVQPLRMEPNPMAVKRMAGILEALDRNRGKPLGQIFKRRAN